MKKINGSEVRELRCRRCRGFITYERIYAGYIVHFCPKCGEENKFTFKFMDTTSIREKIDRLFVLKGKEKGGEKNG